MDQDREVGGGVAVDLAGHQEVAVAERLHAELAWRVGLLPSDDVEALVARCTGPGVDAAQVDKVALATGEVENQSKPSASAGT